MAQYIPFRFIVAIMEATWADIHELWTLLNSVQSIVGRISQVVLGESPASDSEFERVVPFDVQVDEVLNHFEAVDADSSFDTEEVQAASSSTQPVKKKEKKKEKKMRVWRRPTVEEVD